MTSMAPEEKMRLDRLEVRLAELRQERDALRETVENLGRQVGGLPLLRDVIAER